MDGESYYGTTFHEMIHSTGHADRLNRLEPGSGFGSDSYAREELVAELGAALACSNYGIVKNVKGADIFGEADTEATPKLNLPTTPGIFNSVYNPVYS